MPWKPQTSDVNSGSKTSPTSTSPDSTMLDRDLATEENVTSNPVLVPRLHVVPVSEETENEERGALVTAFQAFEVAQHARAPIVQPGARPGHQRRAEFCMPGT